MRISLRRILTSLLSVSIVLLTTGPFARPAGATAAAATVTGSVCVGSTDTLSWTPPAVAGITGYHIDFHNTVYPRNAGSYDLPASQTTLQFPVQLGQIVFFLYAVTSSNVHGTQFATVFAPGIQAPQTMEWGYFAQNVVGDGFVTVTFAWPAESQYYDSGNGNNLVTVTASPGGATMTSAPSFVGGSQEVTDTFTGLTNGVTYSFTSVASNQCGSSGMGLSPGFTPEGPNALTCVVSGTRVPPAVTHPQQTVSARAIYGLATINNLQIVNGTVAVPAFTSGITTPVVVTATKTTLGKPTSWSFDMYDTKGHMRHCG